MRAAIYARVSSLKQSKDDRWSLPDQLKLTREFAQQVGETVVFETSEVHSGATLHRPKIEELFERALAGEYDTIIVHEQDRLSREPKDAAYLEVHARLHGIRLICLDTLPKDGATLSETEEMKIELERLFAKWERHKIYFRTSERRKRRAKEGNLIPSSSPLYGYLWDNDQRGAKKAYVADPQTAPIVRRVFEEIAAGRSLKAIANQLNLEKVLPPAAYHASIGLFPASRRITLHWRPTIVARLVRHPAYWGEHAAYRRATYKTEERTQAGKIRDQIHSRQRKTPEEGLIPLPEGVCPALVSKESAEAAHRQLARNKSQAAKSGKSASLALLRGGIAVCGYCGDKMYCAATSAPYPPRYYCRRSRLKQHAPQPYCEGGNFSIQHDLLDTQVWAIVVDALTNPTALAEALAQHEAEAASNQKKSEERLKALRHLVTQKEGEQERLVLTLGEQEDEHTRKLISSRLKTLAGEIKQLGADVEAEERHYQEPAEQREAIRKLVTWGERKREDLEEASLEERRNILSWLRAQVKVWRADHQPRFEVRLFARPDGGGSPILLGGGNGYHSGGSGENTNSSTWFDGNAKALAHIPHVIMESASSSLPPTNTDHIVLVSQDVAAYKGQQVLGQNGQNLGSTYHLEQDQYALQSVDKHLYWIAPLVYNNVFTNLSNSDTPGYVVVDAEDPDAQAELRTGGPYRLHYVPGALFNQDLLRHVYLSGYTNGNLLDPTLEVDDNWKPYFTISLMQPSRGFTGDLLAQVLLVDPQTGHIQSYDPQNVPSWVDRVMPASTVSDYLTWWGKYENAPWFNPSGSGQQSPSGDPELVYNDVDQPVWLVPMTSSSSNDNSSTGVFLFSTHKNEAHFYPLSGLAVGDTVTNAFKSNPHNIRNYDVSSVQLYQIHGEPTWVAIFVQQASIGATFQAVGLLDARDVQGADVQMESTRDAALTDYTQWLASHGSTAGGPSQNGTLKQVQGTVKRIAPVTQGSSTVYYIWIEGQSHIFTANLSLSPKLPLVQPGDTVTGTYLETGEAVEELKTFDDLSIQLGAGTPAPTPTPTPAP